MDNKTEVRQHNALTNARYEYTELQMDLFFFLLSKLKKDGISSIYQLNIKELSVLTGKKYNRTYLYKATADMGSRMFEVLTEKSYQQVWMFQSVTYHLGQGIIDIKLTDGITPYLFHLKDNYTSYELASALRLTSKYAKRIYQMCSQWKDRGETKKYDIQEFKRILGLVDAKGADKTQRVSDLKSKVLDIAVKQINEHTNLRISYKLEKAGRSFQSVVFTVKPQALAETIPFDIMTTDEPPLVAGISQTQLHNAARILDELRIMDAKHRQTILASATHIAEVNRYNHDLKTGKVKATRNPGGLLLVRLGLVVAKTTKNGLG